MRWSDYIFASDDLALAEFWSDDVPTRVVMGLGFDPRATAVLERFLAMRKGSPTSVLAIQFRAGGATAAIARRNSARMQEICAEEGVSVEYCQRPQPNSDSRARGLRLARDIAGPMVLPDVGRVIVDISSLPTSVYFPLIGALLALLDQPGRVARPVDLQILVTEDPDLDARILAEGTLPPQAIGGFNNELDLEGNRPGPRVWAPVLGEAAEAQLTAIYDRISPDEVCPALPFPASKPRRADDLVLEYRQLLFDRIGVESGNFIYADERNPFDLYRTLGQLVERYRRALMPLGESVLVLSTHSSKTLSLGALLAAYEHRLPVVSAGPTSPVFEATGGDLAYAAGDLTGLWIAGSPFA